LTIVGKDVLKPFGETDVLLFYALVSSRLKKFLKGKELATKVLLPDSNLPKLIHRGSKEEPLYIDEMKEVDEEFLSLRKAHLGDVREKLNKTQQKIWEYFPPRKLMDFLYATNNEGVDRQIDRVFIDIDRGAGISSEQAQQVTDVLVNEIIPKETYLPTKKEPFVSWTGSSFHVYLFLEKPAPNKFYVRNFQYTKDDPEATFTGSWAKIIAKETGLNVVGGHEKKENRINIDPSQTPSGKLARVPLGSLHMADANTVDGVSLPVGRKMLKKTDLVEKLKDHTPNKVVKELDKLAKMLP
jgi:hypothetical protein